MADQDTRMDRVEDAGSHLVYHATLVNLASSDGLPEGALEEIGAASLAASCSSAAQRDFLAKLGPLRTEYSYADGVPAGGFEPRVEDCD